MHPALFLDRDGVVIENRPDYIRSWSDVSIFPQALPALARLRFTPYKIVLVTNQSAVGRGLVSMDIVEGINRRLVHEIELAGGRIDGVFTCPHAPTENCNCRKPRPGLIYQATRALELDLIHSILIGDALSDLEAARAAGIPRYALVLTGRGSQQFSLPQATDLAPFPIYTDLATALNELIPPDTS
jgi:D-glycero-D-manno-heptose 1,7-bisphosphate phosphatase